MDDLFGEVRPTTTTPTENAAVSGYASAFLLALAAVVAYLGRVHAWILVTIFAAVGLTLAAVAVRNGSTSTRVFAVFLILLHGAILALVAFVIFLLLTAPRPT